MSLNITILGLVQMLLVIRWLFWFGHRDEDERLSNKRDFGIRWNPLALSLRQHGLILLLVPDYLDDFHCAGSESAAVYFSFRIWAVLGIVFSVTIISLFLYACVDPFYRADFEMFFEPCA